MIDKIYHPHEVELALQKVWEEKEIYKTTEDFGKEKFYCLSMFPYPSGELHVGHVRNYVLSDVIARYQLMLGKNVLQPIGWDAFGLPAENAAIQNNTAPAKWTYQNIDKMRKQFKRVGLAYDWSREIATCDPAYYRWEQWLFLKMYEKGLVYRKNAVVNWDPVDQTVLANEQVVDGRGWRSGALIERREIPQWFLKITDYADELLANLDSLDWPEQVKTMQRNWIGRSMGVNLTFEIKNQKALQVFTTRVDTLMGATYLAIAPQHPLAQLAAQKNKKIKSFLEKCQHIKVAEAELATMEKEGLDSGFKAIHPITKEAVPIWIANYVLLDYGSGAVMAVPAHDQRDFEFSQKYDLPIKQVIKPQKDWDFTQAAFAEVGTLINSRKFDGLSSKKAKKEIIKTLMQTKLGEAETHYRLRDWGISRQRYWGAPIPMVYCESCGTVPVPEKTLPVILPENLKMTGKGSPLKSHKAFYEVACPTCSKAAHRETDTFDTFMESSWYFDRFACKDQDTAILDNRAKYWTPVNQYIGGVEHAVMHLLYARFIHKVIRDLGFVNSDEPFTKLLTQGMVLKDGAKMSKSKGNVVSPQALIKKYGTDTLRFFSIFTAPPEQSLEWSESGVEGAHRFLNRVWAFGYEHRQAIKEECISDKNGSLHEINWDKVLPEQRDAWRDIHSILKQATQDIEKIQLNTLASACMKLLNTLQQIPKLTDKQHAHEPCLTVHDHLIFSGFSILLRILNPIAPHIAQHLWKKLGYSGKKGRMTWPKVNMQALKTDWLELVVQVNGKLRGKIKVTINADKSEIEKLAKQDLKVNKYIKDKTVKKVIIVPKKLVNIVVEN